MEVIGASEAAELELHYFLFCSSKQLIARPNSRNRKSGSQADETGRSFHMVKRIEEMRHYM